MGFLGTLLRLFFSSAFFLPFFFFNFSLFVEIMRYHSRAILTLAAVAAVQVVAQADPSGSQKVGNSTEREVDGLFYDSRSRFCKKKEMVRIPMQQRDRKPLRLLSQHMLENVRS